MPRDQTRSFLPSLSDSGGGDVRAARRYANDMLSGLEGLPEVRQSARLILTAVCLVLHGRAGDEPTWSECSALLDQLRPCRPATKIFAGSAMQFVRYAAAELDGMDDGTRSTVVDLALAACAEANARLR